MKRLPLVALSLVVVTLALLGRRHWRPAGAPADLRDALNQALFSMNAPGTLAARHAALLGVGGDACAPCHGLHRNGPMRQLWSRYGSQDQDGNRDFSPPSTSVCLSCHDGAVTGGARSYYDADSTSHVAGPGSVPGNSHPVGIDYRAAWLADPQDFNDPSTHPIRLDGGRVGCVSCHTVHKTGKPEGRIGVIENACETCHRR